MSKVKTGALIVIENNVPLGEYERTGITLDALVSRYSKEKRELSKRAGMPWRSLSWMTSRIW